MSGDPTVRGYVRTYAALVALTLSTVAFAYLPLGAGNTVVALAIAAAKAALIGAVFMHLRTSERLTWVVAGGGVLWLAILIGLTLADVVTRARG